MDYQKNIQKQFHKRLEEQWNMAPDYASIDHVNGFSLWQRIKKMTVEKNKKNHEVFIFYKRYSIVASLILLLSLASSIYFYNKKAEAPSYIVSTGIRNTLSITLPDETQVFLGPNSHLVYPKKFTTKKREVELVGQGFFKVKEDLNKPFIVHSENMDVQALGTSFEVYNYKQNKIAETTLVDGKVRITLCNDSIKKVFTITPNYKVTFNKQRNTYSKKIIDASKHTAWQSYGSPDFNNESLGFIINRLEHWYGRKIKCSNSIARKYQFTFKVRDESLEQILHIMQLSSPIEFKKLENGDYELK